VKLIVVLAALIVAACGTGAQGTAARSPDAGPVAGRVSSSGLIESRYTDCNQGGQNLAHYLDTGRPKSNDPGYAHERQQVLILSGEQRALAIRQFADQYIQACTRQKQQAEAATATAKAAVNTKEAATCIKVGGNWSDGPGTAVGSYCQIDYRSPTDGQTYYYTIAFDQGGNIVPFTGGPRNSDECAKSVNLPDVTGHWHPDTDICSI
jgi:hypothetical protein